MSTKDEFCNKWWNNCNESQKKSYIEGSDEKFVTDISLKLFHITITTAKVYTYDDIWNMFTPEQKHKILLKNYGPENTIHIHI